MRLAIGFGMAAVSLVLSAPASGETAETPIGTLTCTSSPARAKTSADTALSCAFKGNSGAHFRYSGTVQKKGASNVPPGKRVFVWSVLSVRPLSSNADLAGSYIGRTGATSAGVLTRQSGASIMLKPPGRSSQLGANSSISVLHLSLKAVRV